MPSATATPASSPYATRREIFGWAMFDFANQAYTLLIITVVFGELFTTVIVGERNDGYRLANFMELGLSHQLFTGGDQRSPVWRHHGLPC